MVPRVLVVVVSLSLVGFAGCLGQADPDPRSEVDPRPTTDPGEGIAPSPTPTIGPTDNGEGPDRPPNASVLPSVRNGTAPLEVTYEIFGEDPEGRSLSWTFDANNDGQPELNNGPLPANFSTTYGVGEHTARLNMTDGNHSVIVEVQINATAPEAVAPPPTRYINGSITGVWVEGTYYPSTNRHGFDLDVPVDAITVTLQFRQGALDLDFEVYTPDATLAGDQRHVNDPLQNPEEPAIHISGEPAKQTGRWEVRVMPGLAVSGQYTIVIEFA